MKKTFLKFMPIITGIVVFILLRVLHSVRPSVAKLDLLLRIVIAFFIAVLTVLIVVINERKQH